MVDLIASSTITTKNGHPNILTYAHKHGGTWLAEVCTTAAEKDHRSCSCYALRQVELAVGIDGLIRVVLKPTMGTLQYLIQQCRGLSTGMAAWLLTKGIAYRLDLALKYD